VSSDEQAGLQNARQCPALSNGFASSAAFLNAAAAFFDVMVVVFNH